MEAALYVLGVMVLFTIIGCVDSWIKDWKVAGARKITAASSDLRTSSQVPLSEVVKNEAKATFRYLQADARAVFQPAKVAAEAEREANRQAYLERKRKKEATMRKIRHQKMVREQNIRKYGTDNLGEIAEIKLELDRIKERKRKAELKRKAREIASGRSPSKKRNGYIYVVGNEAHDRIKIGMTKNSVESRIASWQTGSPDKFIIHAEIPSYDMVEHERVLHDYFADKNTSGEWFEITPKQAIEAVNRFNK